MQASGIKTRSQGQASQTENWRRAGPQQGHGGAERTVSFIWNDAGFGSGSGKGNPTFVNEGLGVAQGLSISFFREHGVRQTHEVFMPHGSVSEEKREVGISGKPDLDDSRRREWWKFGTSDTY